MQYHETNLEPPGDKDRNESGKGHEEKKYQIKPCSLRSSQNYSSCGR